MKVDEAREILGADSESLTDEEVEKHIRVSELLKDIFFSEVDLWQK